MDIPSKPEGASWRWPEAGAEAWSSATSSTTPGGTSRTSGTSHTAGPDSGPSPGPGPDTPRPRRHYKPRTCRICLEVVQPTFEDVSEGPASFLRQRARVRYESPEDGRLMSPCRCKGSQKYVHEGCLQAWRRSQPLSERNYWKCPTCGFAYKLERLRWGRWISNRATRACLTLLVFVFAVYLLGFIADPILDLWLGPMETFLDFVAEEGDEDFVILRDVVGARQKGWLEHFRKGFYSLGFLGVIKAFVAMSPWQWWSFRTTLGGGGRRRAGGRARVDSISWMLILLGVFTFLTAIWRGISYMSGRFLERASERVVDVQGDDDDDEEEDGDEAGENPEARKDA